MFINEKKDKNNQLIKICLFEISWLDGLLKEPTQG